MLTIIWILSYVYSAQVSPDLHIRTRHKSESDIEKFFIFRNIIIDNGNIDRHISCMARLNSEPSDS